MVFLGMWADLSLATTPLLALKKCKGVQLCPRPVCKGKSSIYIYIFSYIYPYFVSFYEECKVWSKLIWPITPLIIIYSIQKIFPNSTVILGVIQKHYYKLIKLGRSLPKFFVSVNSQI